MSDTEDEVSFKVEYAKSSRSKCSGSHKLIPEGALRMGPVVQSPKGDFKYPMWYLFDYFEDVWIQKNPGKLKSVTQVGGFDKLKFEDQQKIKALVHHGDSSAAATKAKPQTAEEKAVEQENKMIWDLKQKLRDNLANKEMKEILEYAEQPCSGPAFGGADAMLDRLADGMLFGWMPSCAEAGGPSTCSNPGAMVYSKGRYKSIGYIDEFTKCTYETKDLKRKKWVCPKWCDNDFLTSFKFKQHKKILVEPEEEEKKEDDDEPKAKRQKTEAGSAKGAAATKSEASMQPFEDCVVAFAGRLSQTNAALEKLITDNGGAISKTIAKTTTIVVSNEAEIESRSKKIADADAKKLPIVKEEWIHDSIAASHKLSIAEMGKANHYLKNAPKQAAQAANLDEREERRAKARAEAEAEAAVKTAIEGEKEKRKRERNDDAGLQEGEEYSEQAPAAKKHKTLKVKGRCAVEPDSGLDEVGRVLDDGKDEIFHATLNRADIKSGKNSYYVMQLIESEGMPKKYWVFRKWGRVGSDIGDKKLEEFSDLWSAKKVYHKQYLDKSGNDWSERHRFTPKPGKMVQLQMDFGEEVVAGASAEGPYAGKLTKNTQSLINLIFDLKAMQSALLEMEIDIEKMPLGKLSKNTIKEGYRALTDISALLKQEPAPADLETRLTGLTNKFYNYVPHAFGVGKKAALIDTPEKLLEKSQTLDALMEMEIATSLLKSGSGDSSGEHVIDANYKKLKTELEEVPFGSEEFKRIDEFIQNTHASTHDKYTLEMVALWRTEREGEAEKFKPWANDKNRKLMYHGSRITNWVGIISQGLRIAPPEAPATGYMFGKGVYFADMSSKSANYCFTSSDKTTGMMSLSEVALGDMYELTKAEYMEKPPKGKQSTWGKGRIEPLPSGEFIEKSGCVIPMGKGAPSTHTKSTNLMYNEFIVYDTAQIKMRYLMRMEFKYKGKCGTFF